MITFEQPWFVGLLLLPLLMKAILPRTQEENPGALFMPFFEIFSDSVIMVDDEDPPRVKNMSSVIVWLLLVLAAARPQYIGEPVKAGEEGRNLMLVLDLSGSMETPDFSLQGQSATRWSAVRLVADSFVQKRKGDRLGVVLFGERAYLYVPLTFDLQTISVLLNEAEVGLAGAQTALGDGLALALKSLIDVPEKSRMVILLSDGVANAGRLKPLQAAEIAQKMGVKVYTIGIGPESPQIPTGFPDSYARLLLQNEDYVDVETLKQIADMTGGKYFGAKSTLELYKISQDIDRLEPAKTEGVYIRPKKELFFYPLGAAFILSVLIAFFKYFSLRGPDGR